MVPVSFDYIKALVRKADKTKYPAYMKVRNKALIVLLYYSARRISEVLGRKLVLEDGSVDTWPGLKVKDFRFDKRKGRDTMIMHIRILKKGKAKRKSIREVYREVVLYCDWPLMDLFLDWSKDRSQHGPETKLFNIGRSRAYQILAELDKRVIGTHWLRHQRLSHMADFLTPYQLNERLGFWESLAPSISYVHGRVGAYLDAGDKIIDGRKVDVIERS